MEAAVTMKTEICFFCFFNFQDEAYSSESLCENHLLSHHFRKHWHEKGLVVGPFSDFVNREEQEKLKITVGDSSEWV